jgi:GAF domain-containing protein
MSTEAGKINLRGRFAKLLEPHKNVQDIKSRQQIRYTAIFSLIFLLIGILSLVGSFITGLKTVQLLSAVVLLITMIVALIFNKTENHNVGSIFLVGGLILSGILLSTTLSSTLASIILLLIFFIPGISLSLVLLPGLMTLIIAITSTVVIRTLPYVTSLEVDSSYLFFFGMIVIDVFFIAVAVMRDSIESKQVEELGTLRKRMNERLEERTRFSRISADILDELSSTTSLEEYLRLAALLITNRFGFSLTRIFLYDEAGNHNTLKSAYSPIAENIPGMGKSFPLEATTLLGWVSENKQYHASTIKSEEQSSLTPELLFNSQAEIGIPILSKNRLLGVLDAESNLLDTFENNEIIIALQTLATQLGASIQGSSVTNLKQSGVQEIFDVFQAGYKVLASKKEEEIYQTIHELLTKSPYISMYLKFNGEEFSQIAVNDAVMDINSYPQSISLSEADLEPLVQSGYYIGDYKLSSLPYNLVKVLRQMKIFNVAVVPVSDNGKVTSLFVIGGQGKQPLLDTNIQPYITLAQQVKLAEARVIELTKNTRQIAEMDSISLLSQEIASLRDLNTLYRTLHSYIRQTIGDKNFQISIYHPDTKSINIPYSYEANAKDDTPQELGTFPLEEGLTSLLINSKQPLLLVEDIKNRAKALGAKIIDTSAKSWLGTPLLVAGEVIGAIIVQDDEKEFSFDELDLKFMTILSSQVAAAIYNTRLLEETRNRAMQLQMAAEIAKDISGSLDLGGLLNKAVLLVRERFDFYHAAIFLVDKSQEYAVIREATGDAGSKMKQASHKLKVGSKSIVGQVTSEGEPMVVNDTANDPVYYANPLLPDTRSEAAIPLILGTRILGAMDVQSTKPFAFTDDVVRVLRILADQISVAVINSELFTGTQENLSKQRLLHQVTIAATSVGTLDEALANAVQGLQVTMGGDHISILLANSVKKVLEVKSYIGYPEDSVANLQIPFGEGVTGWVAANQQTKRINDINQENQYIKVDPLVFSEIAVPISYRGELLGVLNVESDQVNAYDENDEDLLSTLAGSLAGIISNARLIERVRHQVDRERTLFEVTSKIRRSTDMETILSTTASELSKVFGTRRAEIKLDVKEEPDSGEPA